MAQMRIIEVVNFSVLVVLCLLSVAVRAQDGIYSPELAPAPAPDVGAGFSMSASTGFICFSVLLSFIALLLH
ncbi:hypothetical protein PHJA_002702400 [Phtheirospermum japonicum]|uniref:Uncharacterized protein n=1 Tax=Phtheirospermum japonicum TaxID=374723 RepID=A0A830D4L5_9LAMI|nr:hypothetical protein PHJA_002702400 [Phtheirospermum japonicum]